MLGKTSIGGLCALAAVALTACGGGGSGGKPWVAGTSLQFSTDPADTCATAFSPSKTDKHVVCRDSDGVYRCWAAAKIDNSTIYEEVTPFDKACNASLSAVKKAGLVK